MSMKPRRRPGASLPVGAMMALTVLVIAVVLVFGAFQQQSANELKSAEAADRNKQLDQREASLDQRRSELDRRDDAIQSQELALSDQLEALDVRKAQLDGQDAALKAREQTLVSGVQALEEDQKALEEDQVALQKAENDLASRERIFQNAQAETDAKLSDYAELQKAVDAALGARPRIASKIAEALKAAGIAAAADGDGGVALELNGLFSESSAILTKSGQQALNAFLPVWYGAISGESLAALSVEALAPLGDDAARDLAARRAAAIVKYASDDPALDETVRSAFRNMALSGARPDGAGNLAVFRFYLNSDALRMAGAG
jgi:hypothetical protein